MARAYARRQADRTTVVRRSTQLAFLVLNLWIGVRFYTWVRFFETGGRSAYVPRPAGVEGWLPIAGLMNLKYLVVTGTVPAIHPAGLFLLIAFLTVSVVFRKAFCSWLCPVGTLSEWLWEGGRELFGRNFALPRWVDGPLRGLKYLLLFLFSYVIAQMSASELQEFITSPYGLIADVKMLDFFRHAGELTVGVCSALAILSILVKNFWCRYLCPYGALMGLAALFSPVRVTRDPVSCIDCGKCAAACPSLIPVDALRTVKTAECNSCLMCVSACPVKDALELRTLPGRRRISAPVVAIGVVGIFVLIVGCAKTIGAWHGSIPEELMFQLIPNASALTH